MRDLFLGAGIAHSILVFAVVIAIGLYLGKFKIKGISIGSTWILFVAILLSHFGLRVDATVMNFMKDFGLILFVFSIGLQVGPGFFHSFKKGGLQMNILAVALVLLAVAVTVAIHFITGEDLKTMVGVMSGAVTNTRDSEPPSRRWRVQCARRIILRPTSHRRPPGWLPPTLSPTRWEFCL